MRRPRRLIAAPVAVLGLLVAAPAALAASTSTIDGYFGPSILAPDKFRPGSLTIQTHTVDDADPSAIPSPSTNVVIDFDNNFVFDPRGIPRCRANLENTTTAQAISACGNTRVGAGSGSVRVPTGGGGTADFPAVVTAFNGPRQNNHPTILLHSRVDALSATTILVGELSRSPVAGMRIRLDVDVPLIAGGAGALTEFETTVFRRTVRRKVVRRGGRRIVRRKVFDYTQAACPPFDRVFDYSATFTYLSTATDSPTDTQVCQS